MLRLFNLNLFIFSRIFCFLFRYDFSINIAFEPIVHINMFICSVHFFCCCFVSLSIQFHWIFHSIAFIFHIYHTLTAALFIIYWPYFHLLLFHLHIYRFRWIFCAQTIPSKSKQNALKHSTQFHKCHDYRYDLTFVRIIIIESNPIFTLQFLQSSNQSLWK